MPGGPPTPGPLRLPCHPRGLRGLCLPAGERWVSGWDNVPILDFAAGLSDLLDNGNRVWFVVDEGRFDSRYPEEFLQSVWDGMEVVAAQREMLIFRSLDAPGFPASAYKSRRIDFEDGVSVVGGYARAPEAVEPGREDLALLLRWEARSRVSGTYTAFVHLLDEQGEVRAQIDRLPFNGRYSTAHWKPGPTLPD